MSISVDSSDVMALLALLVSIYATWKTVRFNRKQEGLIKKQEELSALYLESERESAKKKKMADIRAKFVNLGKNSDRLKVYNVGEGDAFDVDIQFPGGEDFLIKSDFDSKMPYPKMVKHDSVNLMASFSMKSAFNYDAVITWKDESGQSQKAEVFLTHP
ncbi:hypothetical protein [Salinicola endophyticus]|uniref:Uncharacterized protein n=1 Tax=Salinicola endophyticus TaxID=1949083 RepID=A0AB74UD38_9GAMM